VIAAHDPGDSNMRRIIILAVAPALLVAGTALGRGPGGHRGGGGGGGHHFAGGGGHAFHATPSFSGGYRPQMSVRPRQFASPSPHYSSGFRSNVNPGFRQNYNLGRRPSVNVPGGDRVHITNRPSTFNRLSNRSINRPIYTNRPAYSYHDWHHGYWRNWGRWPWFWAVPYANWLYPDTDYVYLNPYVVETPSYIVESPALDYSQPIPAPPQSLEVMPGADTSSSPPAGQADAERYFGVARELFKRGDYRGAQEKVEQALASLPSDAVLHEFRALTLFAQRKYKEAASVVYAVLSSGPGWDWATMSELYADPQTYTAQLRDLERYQRDNPRAADGHFLLAYHYLVLGYKDQAVRQLETVVRLQPNDKLSAELLKALTQKAAERPVPEETP